MVKLLTMVLCAAVVAPTSATNHTGSPQAVLNNARVRVVKIQGGGKIAGAPLRPSVIVQIDTGDARWSADPAADVAAADAQKTLVVVQPTGAPGRPAPAQSSQPGGVQFTGMSFKPVFENETLRVIRARMDVNAREGFHTHAADTIVVHLSGGEIEDTADGRTVVNRWKPGDIEFEAAGSSHSARNVGNAVDVVLVALK